MLRLKQLKHSKLYKLWIAVYKMIHNSQTEIEQILKKVKQNKKYKSISDEVVRKEIESYLNSNPEIIKQTDKKKIFKKIINEIRTRLHRLSAGYQTKGKNKRETYLDELKKIINSEQVNKKSSQETHQKNPQEKILENTNKCIDITNKILSTNISTKERLKDYYFIYNEIFKITGNPKIIADLGAGINPVSFPYIKQANNLDLLIYYAYDIDNDDIKFINDYFKIMSKFGLEGKAEIIDITNINNFDKLTKFDMIFMFKLVDLIDTKSKKKKKISEQIITYFLKNNKTKFIIVSFSTKTLSGKSMKLPKRKGFELMLLRNNLKFKVFSTDNEVFYVVSE